MRWSSTTICSVSSSFVQRAVRPDFPAHAFSTAGVDGDPGGAGVVLQVGEDVPLALQEDDLHRRPFVERDRLVQLFGVV